VTDLLLRKAQTVRAGAQGDEDYDVVGPDGIVIGRIFEAIWKSQVREVELGADGTRAPSMNCPLDKGTSETRSPAVLAAARAPRSATPPPRRPV
jgi:hypothetical protein